MNSRVRNTRSYMPTRYQDRAAGSHGCGTTDPTCLRGIRTWLQDLTGSKHQIVDRTSQQAIRVGLHDPMGKEQQFQHAYEVSRRGCRISQVRNIRSNITTRYQVGAAGSHGLETTDRTRSHMPTSQQFGAAGSHGFEIPDRTCLRGIRRGFRISRIQNTRSNVPMRCQKGVAGSHGLGKQDRTCVKGIRMGLQDLTGLEQQIQHVYEVSGRVCRISRIRTNRSNMPTSYQDGATGSNIPTRYQDDLTVTAGSHGLGTPDRTCVKGIRMGLQDLTGLEHQIQHAYEVLGRGCKISRVRSTRS